VTNFAIVGFAVGLSFTLRGGGTVDVVYHALMLPLLLLTLVVLLRDDLRQSPPSPDGHQSGPGRSDRRGAGERSQTGTCVCENRHEATGRSMPETPARARLRRRPPAVERESSRRSAPLAARVCPLSNECLDLPPATHELTGDASAEGARRSHHQGHHPDDLYHISYVLRNSAEAE
jgi:hypothetical protein